MDRSTCLEILRSAIAWASSRERPAWARTVQRIEHSEGRYRLEDLQAVRSDVLQRTSDGLEEWFDPVYARSEDQARIAELERPAEEVWRAMVCMNGSLFAHQPGNDPLSPLLTTIASTVPGEGPLYLSLNLDGWGVKGPPAAEPEDTAGAPGP